MTKAAFEAGYKEEIRRSRPLQEEDGGMFDFFNGRVMFPIRMSLGE